MSDFRKGLIVGMLIIFGCGAFVASTTKNANSQRYELHGGLMLDSWKGNLYVMPNNKEDEKNLNSEGYRHKLTHRLSKAIVSYLTSASS